MREESTDVLIRGILLIMISGPVKMSYLLIGSLGQMGREEREKRGREGRDRREEGGRDRQVNRQINR